MTNSSNSDQVILATGGYDHTIKLWQVNSGVCRHTAQHTESQVNALAITPDKQLLAAAVIEAMDEKLKLFIHVIKTTESDYELLETSVDKISWFKLPEGIPEPEISSGHQHIRMYDLMSNSTSPVINYEGMMKNVTGVGFHEEGKWMFTGGEDCSARIWDLRSKNLQCQRIFQVNAPVNCVCLHPNQSELIVGDQGGIIHLWDLKTDHNEQLIPEPDTSIQSVSIDPEGKMVAAVNNKGSCFIWSITSAEYGPSKLSPRHHIAAHRRYALSCSLSPDSKLLVTCSADQTARLWETENFSLVMELKHDSQRWVWDAAFSADSKYLITASSDGIARLWNLDTGNIEREYTGHQKPITALAYSDTPVQSTPNL